MSQWRVVAGLLGMVLIVGCEKPSAQSTSSSPAPTSAPSEIVTTAPATAPIAATTQPANSILNINGHSTPFPPARMRLETDGQHVVALVFSDDPKDALKDNYTGNSFYLRMELDIDSPEKLAEANWHFTAPSSGDREDSPYGIYLGGKKLQLQPYDVMGRFKVGEGGGTDVLLSGQFQVVEEATTRGPPQLVPIGADIPVRVDAPDAKKK